MKTIPLIVVAALIFTAGCSTPDQDHSVQAGSSLPADYFKFSVTTESYDSPPVLLKGDAPPYPWPLLAHVPQVYGHAILSFTIDEHGRAVNPRVVETTHRYFASAVATAMKTWRFKPALKNGIPVPVFIQRLRFGFAEPVGGTPLKV